MTPTPTSQATAELPSLKADFEAAMHEYGSKLDFLVLEGSTRYAYMETEWAFRGYEAGRASRAQSEWETGAEDADGNPLVTVRSDALVALAEFALTPALTSIRVGEERLSRAELTNRLMDAVKCAAPATLGETK